MGNPELEKETEARLDIEKKSLSPPLTDKEEAARIEEKLRPEREATFRDYLRVFTYAQWWDLVLMVVAAVASVAAGTTLPLMNVVFGQLVGNFNSFGIPGGATDFESQLNRLSLYIFILFLARFFLNYLSKFSFRMIGIRISAAIRLDYLIALFGQTIHVLDSMPPGAAAGTITTTANTLQLGISEKLGTFLEFSSTVVTAIIVAFIYSWRLTLVTASIILFLLLIVGIFLPFIIKGTNRVTKAETRAASVASEAFSSIRMVMACGAEEQTLSRFSVWADKAMQHSAAISPFIATQFGFIFFGIFAAFGLAFWYGAKAFTEGTIPSVSNIVIVIMSVMMMLISIQQIVTPLLAVSKAIVAACEFFTVIDAPRPTHGSLKAPEISSSDDIIFEDVFFAYPSRPHVKVLDGLSLRVPAGKITAIVGPSGSGKSTIVGLIERWYTLHDQHIIATTKQQEDKKKKEAEKKAKAKAKGKATDDDDDDDVPVVSSSEDVSGPLVELKGSIRTSGHELEEIDLRWWRSQIGLVQQEPFLFNNSIYHNVAYGLIGSEFENESEERKRELVVEACKESFADEFIDRLPDGYDTIVGESGTKLSGGQRQRISIARAVIKKPKILILDEATSAIDVRGERIVQAALDKVSKDRTTVTIAHRLSTIKKADNIAVIKKGQVVEQGTHESLLEDETGVYWGLVNAQHLSLGEPTDAEEVTDTEEDELQAYLSREKSASKAADEAMSLASEGWKNKGLVGSFGRLLYEQRSRFPYYFFIVVSAMCVGAGNPVQAYLFGKIVVVFQDANDIGAFSRDANFWSLIWFIMAIAIGIAYFALGFSATRLQAYISATYKKQYFEGMLHQKVTFFDEESHSTGTLTALIGGDPKQLEELLGMNMGMATSAAFTVTGSLIVAFVFGWKLALVATCVTMPIGLFAGFYRLKFELEFEKLYSEVFSESSKFAAEAIGAFRTVSSMTLEETISKRYEDLLRGHVTKAYKKARWTTIIFALADSVSLACQALIFWYGGRLLVSGEYQALNFFVCYMAVIQGAESAGQGFSFGPNAAQASAAANRILSVRDSRRRGESTATGHISDVEGGMKIELENVHFKYPSRNVSIFKGLSITIEKGQFAALVGASGCGKTSIISLLERFYDVQKGRILANGTDITDVNLHEYRQQLSLVAQEASIFQGTLRENILLGVDPTSVAEERLHAVCRDASIHDFIISLPDGYNTEVGSKGVSLSGGQKQRIAIARALIRNPHVLLLDEATSSLDSESEKLVQGAFERAAEGRTMIVVAHRLATVQNADVIFVLGEGKVLEKGNHQELLKKKGVYWNMCQSQALDR